MGGGGEGGEGRRGEVSFRGLALTLSPPSSSSSFLSSSLLFSLSLLFPPSSSSLSLPLQLCLWDINSTSTRPSPRFTLTDHQAAVKALAWSPHDRNLLATGGGTADRCIKFWNGATGSLLNSIDTGSQVCALQWNRHEKEILSSHGFAKNQLCLWNYPTMTKVKELNGHTARVLHMAQSPDGTQVVSAAADETLRFWDVFGEMGGKKGGKRGGKEMEGKSKKLAKTFHMR